MSGNERDELFSPAIDIHELDLMVSTTIKFVKAVGVHPLASNEYLWLINMISVSNLFFSPRYRFSSH